MMKLLPVAFACAALCSACTWVDLSEQGQAVRVAVPGEVGDCRRLGEVTASVVDKVAFMKRSREKQARELETLARNEAGQMGGDAIVASGDIQEGRRPFTVYQCN